MKLTSPDFDQNEIIPVKFTCQGENVNPSLYIEDIPERTESLALIIDDPDSYKGTWTHWVVYDIPRVSQIEENMVPGTQGVNDFHKIGYGGPCPKEGTHRYFFKVYALDQKLNLEEGKTKEELLGAMEGHIIEQAELIGLYKKKKKKVVASKTLYSVTGLIAVGLIPLFFIRKLTDKGGEK